MKPELTGILDHQFLHELEKGKHEKQKRFFFWKKYEQQHISLSNLQLASLVLLVIVLVLASQIFFPTLGPVQTLAGRYATEVGSLTSLQHQIDQGIAQTANLTDQVSAMQRLDTPADLLALRQEIRNNWMDPGPIFTNLYRIVEDILPRNFIARGLVFTKMSFDPSLQTLVLEGRINNQTTTSLPDQGSPFTGYSVLSYLVMDANRSSFFQKSTIESVKADTDNPGGLLFRLNFYLQHQNEQDEQDSNQNFIDYMKEKLQDNKVKR